MHRTRAGPPAEGLAQRLKQMNARDFHSASSQATLDWSAYAFSTVQSDGALVLLRGIPHCHGSAILLAQAASSDKVEAANKLLDNEFRCSDLLDAQWALRPIARERHEGATVLLYDNLPAQPLSAMRAGALTLSDWLDIAVHAATALAQLHAAGLLHRAISPTRLFADARGHCWLTGFGHCVTLSDQLAHDAPPRRLPSPATAAFMSPEQTEYTQDAPDTRSDLYSLGVVLYWLLTGHLPFNVRDPDDAREWAHCHVAYTPTDPRAHYFGIPAAIAQILLKLLDKRPAARYQQADGLVEDLRRCQVSWNAVGRVDSFALGTRDRSSALRLGGHLHGRAAPLQALRAALQATNGVSTPGLVLVCGDSGIGKTALLDTFTRTLSPHAALTVRGKADQSNLQVPYAPLTEALDSLAQHALSLPAGDLANYRDRIRQTIGPDCSLLRDLIPSLALIEDEPAPQTALAPDQARARFILAVRGFLRVFAGAGRPLVLVVEDVQWLDTASLALLEALLDVSEPVPLLVVASTRTLAMAAVDGVVRIPESAARLQRAATYATRIVLEPLSADETEQWVAELLGNERTGLRDLAALVHEKTLGNPFFVAQFLQAAIDDRLIIYAAADGHWHYDLAHIRQRAYTDNVVDVVLHRLDALPGLTRRLLGTIACLGRRAPANLLAKLHAMEPSVLDAALAPALQMHAIQREGDQYAFLHDRIQEAAYASLSESEHHTVYFDAGWRLASLAFDDQRDDLLLPAAQLLAHVVDRIATTPQAQSFALLSRNAARRARKGIAYDAARRYASSGLAALRGAGTPPEHDALGQELMMEDAECTFIQGDLTSAMQTVECLLTANLTLARYTAVIQLKAQIHTRRSENVIALETTLAGLRAYGIDLPAAPSHADLEQAQLRTHQRLAATTLDALAPLTDTHAQAAIGLLAAGLIPATFTNERIFALLLCKMLDLTLDYGISAPATAALAWFGVILSHDLDAHQEGFAYAQQARALVAQHGYTDCEAATLLPLDQVSVWTQPLSFAVDCARAAYTAALASGDVNTACYATCHLAANLLARGDALSDIAVETERGLAFVQRAGFRDIEDILRIQHAFVSHLLGSAPNTDVDTLDIDLGRHGERMATLHFWYWLFVDITRYFERRYADAREALARANALAWSAPGHIHQLDLHLFSALLLDAQDENALETIASHETKLRQWAQANPATFADKLRLIEAKRDALHGRIGDALRGYEDAAQMALHGGFVHVAAIAAEEAAALCQGAGLFTAAQAYAQQARERYARWGAAHKVEDLTRADGKPAIASPAAGNTANEAPEHRVRDVDAIVRCTRALAEEIQLERLINTLMSVVLEHAGAQRGVLIRMVGELPVIEARARTTAAGIVVELSRGRAEPLDLPLTMLNTALRTRKRLVVHDAAASNPFAHDPYFSRHNAGCAMCLPMLKGNVMAGVLFVENGLLAGRFAGDTADMLELIAGQAAVSLENARLYHDLVEENTRRHRIEEALRVSEETLALGERVSQTGSWRWDLKRDVCRCSEELRHILDIATDQLTVPRDILVACIHPDDRERVRQMSDQQAAAKESLELEYRIVRKDGTTRHVVALGKPIQHATGEVEYVGTVTDITARRQAEDAARNAQADVARVARATTVGQLTASIAHEVNQPLMSIVSHAGASLRWLDRNPPALAQLREGLVAIASEGQRAGDMIHSLQALTRNTPRAFVVLDIHETIRHIVQIARSELNRRDVSLELELNANHSHVHGDAVQLQQVLLNLVLNAIDAMATVHERQRVLRLTTTVTAEAQLQVCVEDNGQGLASNAAGRMFEPFYTTKAHGMGMGLAICRSIVEAHKGSILAAPRLPFGALFMFRLPLAPVAEP